MKKNLIIPTFVCLLLVLAACTSSHSIEMEHTTGERNTDSNDSASIPYTETEDPTEQAPTTTGLSDWAAPAESLATTEPNNTAPEDDTFEYDVNIGASFYTIRENVLYRIIDECISCLIWKDAGGYKIAIGYDKIRAVVDFSKDLKLLRAEGVEPIKAIDPEELAQWAGKKEAEFVEVYGPCHYDAGSGISYPSYIGENGTIYWLGLDWNSRENQDVIKEIHAISLNDLTYKYPPEYFPQVLDALQECGIPTELAPRRVPDGYTVDYINRAFIMDRITVDVKLKNQQDHRIVVSVEKCSESFQFDEELRGLQLSATRAFSFDGRTFYLTEQKDGWSAVWTDGSYRISLVGFETVEDLQDTIRSMKEQ